MAFSRCEEGFGGWLLPGPFFALVNAAIVGIFLAMFWAFAFLAVLGATMDNPGATFASLAPLSNALIAGFAIYLVLGILALIFIRKGKREFT